MSGIGANFIVDRRRRIRVAAKRAAADETVAPICTSARFRGGQGISGKGKYKDVLPGSNLRVVCYCGFDRGSTSIGIGERTKLALVARSTSPL